MAGETRVTVVGNLTADPDLRYTSSGTAVANFTVAATPRVFDRASGEWKDGDALFLRCSIWWQPAENVAASLTKGARVVVEGVLRQRSFETKEGEKRTVVELDVDEIGASLRFASVKIQRNNTDGDAGGAAPSNGNGNGGRERRQAAEPSRPVAVAAAPAAVGAGGSSGADDDF
jgi:single-strand DNA-binding protein